MQRINFIFFDLDDTLNRWQESHTASMKHAIDTIVKANLHIDSGAIAEKIIAITSEAVSGMNQGLLSFQDVSGLLVKELGLMGINETFSRGVIDDYRNETLRTIRVWDDCTVLEELSRGYRLGVITNGPGEWQRVKLRHMGLEKMFDVVICSSDYGLCKPDIRLFDEACRKAEVKPENCMMVGNSFYKDAVGAREAGMHGVWLNRDDSPLPAADWDGPVIRSFTDLPGILSQMETVA